MSKAEKIKSFDPSGVGLRNGHFIGLPFDESDAEVVLLSVPWDVTVSSGEGTSTGPANILACSPQLDLFDPDIPDAWKIGLYMRPPNEYWQRRNQELRPLAKRYIDFLEEGGDPAADKEMSKILDEINQSCKNLKDWVYLETRQLMEAGKLVGIAGGEHSVPLGYLQALAERHGNFGILQIDAHMDLREAYEGFSFSHASIFFNALQIPQVTRLVQVGIRDYCEAEWSLAQEAGARVQVFTGQHIREMQYEGATFQEIAESVIRSLPGKVYISFDIDGLDPGLCPNTGTPVPGGLQFQEAMYLINHLRKSGKTIIGFDLCEVGGEGNEWDGNVGARVLYKLANLLGSQRS
jgi:agmatinase